MPKVDPIAKAQGARLKIARKAAHYRSARDAALSNGWPESTYRAHEAGTRTIGLDDAERYARRFRAAGARITPQEILFGDKAPPLGFAEPSAAYHAGTIAQVPVIDWVSAGRLAESGSQIPVEDVPLLAFADLGRGDFFALKVRGNSMDRISPEGSTIVVDRADKRLVAGKPYVFSIRGEATYKLWRPDDPPYLEPFSWDHSHKPLFVKKKRDLEVVGRVRRTLLDL